MKTTVDISDDLLQKAKKLALQRRVTMKQVLEEGLRLVLREPKRPGGYKLPDLSVGGHLSEEFVGSPWSEWRKAAYGDRE